MIPEADDVAHFFSYVPLILTNSGAGGTIFTDAIRKIQRSQETSGEGWPAISVSVHISPHQVGFVGEEHSHSDYGNADPGLAQGSENEFPIRWAQIPFCFPGGKASQSG